MGRYSRREQLTIVKTLILVLVSVQTLPGQTRRPIEIGSKKFTESVILGEILRYLVEDSGYNANHRRQLGGTRVLWNALLAGEIDIYPEYTGTIRHEILAGKNIESRGELGDVLAEYGVQMSEPLGFNNTYALGVKKSLAAKHGLEKISDLRKHPKLSFGFSNEFMDRQDGWPGLRDRYNLPQTTVRGLDHDLAYRGLDQGSIDVIDLYATDAEIRFYDIAVLEDDLAYFSSYHAVVLYRSDLKVRAPAASEKVGLLAGSIDEEIMIAMNARAKIEQVPESRVAVDFISTQLNLPSPEVRTISAWSRLAKHTREHLILVAISLAAAILISVPLGVLAALNSRIGQVILGIVGIIQTIPSLALFVFMIPLLGIGGPPAVVALFLYSLLPIVRNTYAGLHDIPIHIHESAIALGLPTAARLRRIELPLASRSILAGVKTSAVINVGTATLGALIGSGGYGDPILTGIRLADTGLILLGAVPAAGLALLSQGIFEIAERYLVPRGLRLNKGGL